MGIKLYRLAVDIDWEYSELLEKAQEVGLPVKSYLETLSGDDARELLDELGIELEVDEGHDEGASDEAGADGASSEAPDVDADADLSDAADEPAGEPEDERPEAEPETEAEADEPESGEGEGEGEGEPEADSELSDEADDETPVDDDGDAAAAEDEAGDEDVDDSATGSAADIMSAAIHGTEPPKPMPERAKPEPAAGFSAADIMSSATSPKKAERTEVEKALLAERLAKLRKSQVGIKAQVAPPTSRRGGTQQRGQRGRGIPQRKSAAERARDARNRLREKRNSTAARTKAIEISLPITIKDLSQAIGVPAPQIIRYLMTETGGLMTINAIVEQEMVELIAIQFEKEVVLKKAKAAEEHVDALIEALEEESQANLHPRPPVVAVMGHVDHGKTSLLDKIRKTNMADGEAGGITQHVSAWAVERDGKKITFVDTPGHAAFSRMRARGADATDIVVLVVAADDGPMPQTEEALAHAQAADKEIIVALNKIDRPNANVEQAMQKLAAIGLQGEEWGGDTVVVKTSALTGEGIDELLEMIHLKAELLELQANPDIRARGIVLEGKKDIGLGNVATLLVTDGTLRRGDALIAGLGHGKVRAMTTAIGTKQRTIKVAGPSTPVNVTGLSEVPDAGDHFVVAESISQAKEIGEERTRLAREAEREAKGGISIESIFKETVKAEHLELIVKADVKGTVEVLKSALADLATEEVKVKLVHSGIGAVNESDVELANASGAMILAFNVAPESRARKLADQRRVEIRPYSVIYKLLDDVKQAMEGLLAPDLVEEFLGSAVIKQLFKSSKLGTIAGCSVTDGTITRNAFYKLVRDGKIITSKLQLSSLKRFKDDVREVKEGYECGLLIKNYNDIKEGDVLEAFKINEVARTLD